MKRKLSHRAAMIILISVMAFLIVALIIQIVQEGKFTSDIAVRTLIPMGVCASAMAKVLTGTGGRRGLSFYAEFYKKEIGTTFAAVDRKAARKLLLKSLKAYNEDRYEHAVRLLKSLITRCQSSEEYATAYLFLGLTYTDMSLPDKAIEAYKTLLTHDTSRAAVWNNLGMLYAGKGMTAEAAEHYRRATEVDPNYAMAYNNMAQMLLRAGRWEKTISYADHAYRLQKNLLPAIHALAIAHYALGHRTESRRYTDMAILHGSDAKNLENIFFMLDRGENPFNPHVRLTPEVEEAMDAFRRRYARPMAQMGLPAEGKDIGRSRVGGVAIGDIPTDSHGYPMRMLAAIWCSEVQGVPDLPDTGILRFFIADDRYHGFDRNHPTEQADFRVLYTEDEEAFGPCVPETYLGDREGSTTFPVQGSFPAYFSPTMGTPLASDYRFRPALVEALAKVGAPSPEELEPALYRAICEQNTWGGHRIGGYPCFEQSDPREYEPYRVYDVLLLQIVTHTLSFKDGRERTVIRFGNDGGCQFFIPRDKLRAKDFSDVFYWWDDIPENGGNT